MNHELITALMAFAFVSSITPGPNNLMLMSSGANYGFQRSLPHLLGVGLGFTLMLLLVGVGLIRLFDLFPASHGLLQAFSIAYLGYLAFKIATTPVTPPADNQQASSGTPMTFLQAALFQWVNPKGWTMALTAISVYAPTRSLGAVVLTAAVFGAINLPSCGTWVVLGQQLRRWLTNAARMRAFNLVMAALLLASLYPVLAP